MKDFMGRDVQIGDTVAIIYHPRAYRFSVKPAIIVEQKGKQKKLITQLRSSGIQTGFLPEKDGETYKRIVKINSEFPELAENEYKDAVGHPLSVGATIVCRKPVEGGGNTLKGFEDGGVVKKMTDSYVFFKDAEGATKHKAYSNVVVIER